MGRSFFLHLPQRGEVDPLERAGGGSGGGTAGQYQGPRRWERGGGGEHDEDVARIMVRTMGFGVVKRGIIGRVTGN